MRKFIFSMTMIFVMLLSVSNIVWSAEADDKTSKVEISSPAIAPIRQSFTTVMESPEPSPFPESTIPPQIEEPVEIVPAVADEDIELIALLTMTEAESEPEEGQRLVIDSVLNRVDNPHFPDTISGVVWQKNQFSGMYGNRIERCYVRDDLVQLVREELENRTNYDVIFFRTEHYHSYGVPMFQVGAHYFSSYD